MKENKGNLEQKKLSPINARGSLILFKEFVKGY